MKIITNFRLLLIALWLGAAMFFSFSLAPSAFGVLPSREMAGSVVSANLSVINYAGLIIGAVMLLSSFISSKGAVSWLERLLMLIFTIACAVGQFVISYQLASIRNQVGRPIEELSTGEPLRIAFDSLHQYSIWVLATAMIIALISFLLISTASPKAEQIGHLTDLG
jgi:Domain of unknown function (DUF4149)